MTIRPLVLVAGASGYVASQLIPRLLDTGYAVRAVTRRPDVVGSRPWADDVQIHAVNWLEGLGMQSAMVGVDVAYFLAQSIGTESDFVAADLRNATLFSRAADVAGVGRIIYLGPTHDSRSSLSAYIMARRETASILASARTPSVVLWSSPIIGPGSVARETLSALGSMGGVIPSWATETTRPIAVADATDYLLAAARTPVGLDRQYVIGGPDLLSFGDAVGAISDDAIRRHRHLRSVPSSATSLVDAWLTLSSSVTPGGLQALVSSLKAVDISPDAPTPSAPRHLSDGSPRLRSFPEAIDAAQRTELLESAPATRSFTASVPLQTGRQMAWTTLSRIGGRADHALADLHATHRFGTTRSDWCRVALPDSMEVRWTTASSTYGPLRGIISIDPAPSDGTGCVVRVHLDLLGRSARGQLRMYRHARALQGIVDEIAAQMRTVLSARAMAPIAGAPPIASPITPSKQPPLWSRRRRPTLPKPGAMQKNTPH